MRTICLLLGVLLAACTAKITGDLQVDGTSFNIVQCRSGQAFGFSGVEFADQGGRRLRLLMSADGSADVALFQSGNTTGDTLGMCGRLTAQAQNSRINSIVNLQGDASLACDALGHKVTGKVTFENCH